MSLVAWILGRGRNPLEVPERSPRRVPSPAVVDDEEDPGDARVLGAWAAEHGVTPDVMSRLVAQRRVLVAQVAEDPRAWGFDLLAASAPRRDVATELRAGTRLQGALAASFLAGHAPLLALVPDPPTLPDGTPLDEQLVRAARLEREAARDLASHVRSTIQARLGRPLDPEAFEHAVREAAWDHDLDAQRTLPRVLDAVSDVLWP